MSRFLFVIPTLVMGGAERVVAVLSSALARAGQDIYVLKYYEKDNEYTIDDTVKVIYLSEGEEKYKQTNIVKRVWILRKRIKEVNPDYVLPFLFPVAQAVFLASVGIKSNVFQSIRISPSIAPSSKLKRFLRDYLVYRSKCTFVQNEHQRLYFKESARSKIHVLYNPVSDDLFEVEPRFESEEYTICSAGRLEKQKNFKLLIDSFALAFSQNKNVVLHIYGEGSCRSEYEQYILERGLQNRVILKGRTNNITEGYKNSDLFVLSSDYEGMPNALLEAMACGLPCISTDCPTGPSELIEDHKNGILVPVRNVQEMSQAMIYMYSNRVESHKMGILARQAVRTKCQADNIAKEMIEICKTVK